MIEYHVLEIMEADDIVNKYTSRIHDEHIIRRFKLIEIEQRKESEWQRMSEQDKKVQSLLEKIYTFKCHYRYRKDRNNERKPGTCEWFTNHSHFKEWNDRQNLALLRISADSGVGKSVLGREW